MTPLEVMVLKYIFKEDYVGLQFFIAKVWDKNFSTYFEYNSRFFLLGSSYAPFEKVPIRGNFALILSDHVDNYKLHNGSEMNWVFNLSLVSKN